MYQRAAYKETKDWESIPDPVGTKKYDGASFFARVEPDGSIRYFSRRQSVKGHFPERTSQLPHLTDVKLPQFAGNVYNVELIHTGHNKDDEERHNITSGILNSLAPRAIETQKLQGPIRAVLFDVIHPKIDTYKEKLEHLKTVEEAFGKPNLLFVPSIKIGKEEVQKLIEDTKKNKSEGVIVASLTTPEDKNTRIKIKHFITYNLRVVGITREYDIKGNPKESAGALVLADRTGRIVGKVGTGFTRDQRIEIHNNPKSWIGRLVQVRALPPTGQMIRTPSFNGDADGSIDQVFTI